LCSVAATTDIQKTLQAIKKQYQLQDALGFEVNVFKVSFQPYALKGTREAACYTLCL
jgi:hypothetical protein